MYQSESVLLTELHKNYPLFCNAKDKNYRNRLKREDAWKEISAAMEIRASTIKTKMKILMITYRSEKYRDRKSRITGSVKQYNIYLFT